MSENENLNCQQSKDHLDVLTEAMVEARIRAAVESRQSAFEGPGHDAGQGPGPKIGQGHRPASQIFSESNLEPTGALKKHLANCSDCHNYQLANRVIIEAARALPKLEGDEDLTQSILALIQESQESNLLSVQGPSEIEKEKAKVPAPKARQFAFSQHSVLVLVASFLAFTFIISTTAGFTIEAMWSAGSWALALVMVALLKPLIEGNFTLAHAAQTAAKA
jgi:hypothetical protein